MVIGLLYSTNIFVKVVGYFTGPLCLTTLQVKKSRTLTSELSFQCHCHCEVNKKQVSHAKESCKLYLSCLCNDWLAVCGFILFYLRLPSRVKLLDKNCYKVPQLYDLKWMSHFHIQTRSQLTTCGKATQWYTVPWRKCHLSSAHCDAGHVNRVDDDNAHCWVNIQGAPSSVRGQLIPPINVWSETAFNLWEICLSKNVNLLSMAPFFPRLYTPER